MLSIQPLTEADVSFAINAENHPDNRRSVGQWNQEQYLDALSDPDYQCFLLVASGERIGHCILADLQNTDNSILLKRIVVQVKGKGYGRAALGEIAEYAFRTLKANRLWLDVRAFNTRAESLYQSVGFRREGTLIKASRVDDEYVDLHLYGMLQEEYSQRSR